MLSQIFSGISLARRNRHNMSGGKPGAARGDIPPPPIQGSTPNVQRVRLRRFGRDSGRPLMAIGVWTEVPSSLRTVDDQGWLLHLLPPIVAACKGDGLWQQMVCHLRPRFGPRTLRPVDLNRKRNRYNQPMGVSFGFGKTTAANAVRLIKSTSPLACRPVGRILGVVIPLRVR
jgi:hypothetical protein